MSHDLRRQAWVCLAIVMVTILSGPASAQTLGPQLRDPQGLKACLAFKDALDIFLKSGYFPGLRHRISEAAGIAAGSNDAYLRNATSTLAAAKTADELMTWLKITTDVCVNRTLTTSPTTVLQAPRAPTIDPPRLPAPPITPAEAARQTERAAEQSGSKTCQTKTYGGGAAVTVCE
jgi:hypothetical protein